MKEAGPSSIGRTESKPSFQAEEFYRRWKAPVFTFCSLYLGDKHLAGDATSRAFLSYYRQHSELKLDQLPPPLIGAALAAAGQLASFRTGPAVVTRAAGEAQPLTDAIANLAADERTVFILRTVLKMDDEAISAASGLPLERVHGLWQNALRMLSTTPANGSQRSSTLSRMPSVREGTSAQDGDRNAWTGSRPRIERSLKCGI